VAGGARIILLKGNGILFLEGYGMNSEPLVAIEDGGEKGGMIDGQPEIRSAPVLYDKTHAAISADPCSAVRARSAIAVTTAISV
jgi:hypothetical protein